MAAEDLITSTGTTVTHDETAGLQNSTATPDVPLGTLTTTTLLCRRCRWLSPLG